MTDASEVTDNVYCAMCGEHRQEHKLANFAAGGPGVGQAFLVCPRNTFVSRARQKREQSEIEREFIAASKT